MPPRRSCFRMIITGIPARRTGGPVSMPPRRSCFISAAGASPGETQISPFQCHHGVPASRRPPGTVSSRALQRRFNATTAFLLRSVRLFTHGFLLPRPCFNATTAFLLRRASGSGDIGYDRSWRVSMPPRRSCFVGAALPLIRDDLMFQCHHGVPASRPVSAFVRDFVHQPCFNATTAFLLPAVVDGRWRITLPTPVSMPPRRSCFDHEGRPHPVWEHSTPVSMPPRRSCFKGRSDREHRLVPPIEGFNATTAFLLPRFMFGSLAPWGPFAFQCHHGVPASVLAWLGAGRSWPSSFQCHHGVPASRGPHLPAQGVEGLRVSMPPRRSCFPASAKKMAITTLDRAVSMPPRRSCFTSAEAGVRAPAEIPSWFQCHHGVPASPFSLACHQGLTSEPRFNATTAFLLHPNPRDDPPGCGADPGFQCHHGVPASLGPRCHNRSKRDARAFQCHHGVPASAESRSRFHRPRYRTVSMPPRRSCFHARRLLPPARFQ
jgi:hypothetical protein